MTAAIFTRSRPLSADLVKRISGNIVQTLNAVDEAAFLGHLGMIELSAAALKVGLQHEYDAGARDLFISDLGRDLNDPNTKGNGAKVMQMLCDLADGHGVTLSISYMTDEPGLGRYYARFGFLPEANPEHITNMSRPPVRPQ